MIIFGVLEYLIHIPDINDPDKWPGQNLLGKALMKTREILRNGSKYP
jgi:hypothetical protein